MIYSPIQEIPSPNTLPERIDFKIEIQPTNASSNEIKPDGYPSRYAGEALVGPLSYYRADRLNHPASKKEEETIDKDVFSEGKLENPLNSKQEELKKLALDYDIELGFEEDGRPFIIGYGRDQNGQIIKRPYNTGLEGQGKLFKWGVNPAADNIITNIDENGKLRMLLVKRGDNGQYALPGGMLNAGETPYQAALRELMEEVKIAINPPADQPLEEGVKPVYIDVDGEMLQAIYEGLVDDIRNTNNAFITSSAFLFNLDEMVEPSGSGEVDENGEAEIAKSEWVEVTPDVINKLYASHSLFVKKALADWYNGELNNGQKLAKLPENTRKQIYELFKAA
jgi:8-oxo-dGTP pyrophosphatase MutT (NUDIX family)